MPKQQPAFGRGAGARRRNARSGEGGFWHRPDWMNLVSDVLIVVASVALGYAAVKLLLRAPMFALNEVVITSPLTQVTPAQLEYAAASLRGTFFTVDLDQGRQAFEKLPWVRSAQLRRRWPATVEVNLEEHAAVAYWLGGDSGDMRLVNSAGEIFDAASNAPMPTFSGPAESAAQMLEQWKRLNEQIKPLNRHIVGLTLSSRRAWQIRLDDGLVVELGRDQIKAPIKERLNRFVAAYPHTVVQLGAAVVVADLRYPSGFAVKLGKELRTESKAVPATARGTQG